MKGSRIVLPAVVGVVLAFASTRAHAQVHHEIALTRSEIQAERQQIVAENLPLDEEHSKAFWPLYREYRGEISKVGDRFISLVEEYAKNYDKLTDEQAQKMVDDFLSVQKDELKIKSDWVSKFKKAVPPKALARFYQIENKLDTIIRLGIAEEIPLVPHKPQGK